ncbi:MAG: carbamoyltransferase HypF [Acidobacteriota bacterium]
MSQVNRQKEVVSNLERLSIRIHGAVQGVGFRPFIYRLAMELGLKGWVNNSGQGVFIDVEGSRSQLENFFLHIEKEKPRQSFIQSMEPLFLEPIGYRDFEIRESDNTGKKTAIVLPDIATCSECLNEVLDINNRRYHYPFTNCTNCGPRYTIIEALPYDRTSTTMKKFKMCRNCIEEYENPLDRRFHAQPNACPECGPQLELWDNNGKIISRKDQALLKATIAIREGKIIAVKGIGGFHLIVDAGNDEAIKRLRSLKHRDEKPFALLYPSLRMIDEDCEISMLEERLLCSTETPIVLLRRRASTFATAANSIAPNNPYWGIMLPSNPLHHLLMIELKFPVIATSGNISDESICIDEAEALVRLGKIADLFLVHNRPIARRVDDSIARIMLGRELILRRARGYAPLPIHFNENIPSLLAFGAHLKNSIAASIDKDIFVSQHIGDLASVQAFNSFQQTVKDLQQLYQLYPIAVVCDTHPEYLSTKFAEQSQLPVVRVQHHYAHVLSCMAENELTGSVLGICWDGTGYGLDETIWGGEFLRASSVDFQRVAHFHLFQLPGGEKALREPRRVALGVLYQLFGNGLFEMRELAPLTDFSQEELRILRSMLEKKISSPLTSSVGRLFDAVASIVGLRQKVSFEGQAAMELEFALDGINTDESYPFELITESIIDWRSIIEGVLQDLKSKISIGRISAKFHNTLVETIIAVAKLAGEERVVLTGGCFQNRYLTEQAVIRLKSEGFNAYWHQRIPPNDGGIALGQIVAATSLFNREQ